MENNMNESVNNLEVAGQEETVESTVTNDESVETVDNTEDTTTGTENIETTEETEDTSADKTEIEKQNKEDNKFARLARIQAEKEAQIKIDKARKEGIEQGMKLGKIKSYIGRENPYTGEIITDDYDAQEYLDMYELEAKGKDPVKGYRELQKEKAKAEAQKQIQIDEETKKKKWFEDDTKDFVEKYSIEKLNELSKDADFNLFANGKVGQRPLAEIYEDYSKFTSKYEKKSVQTAKQIVANNNTTPGGVGESETKVLDWNNMSSEEFEKYYQKALNGEM